MILSRKKQTKKNTHSKKKNIMFRKKKLNSIFLKIKTCTSIPVLKEVKNTSWTLVLSSIFFFYQNIFFCAWVIFRFLIFYTSFHVIDPENTIYLHRPP